jgi:hypothetical protein
MELFKKIGIAVGVATIVTIGYLSLSGQYVPGGGALSQTALDDAFDPDKVYTWGGPGEFDHVTPCSSTNPSPYFSGALSGATTVACSTGLAGHPGILSLTTGTAATDGFRFVSNAIETIGNVPKCADFAFRINNIPTSVNWYMFRLGLARYTAFADATDGIALEYRPSAASTFQLVVTRGGVRTAATCTGVTPTANTFYRGSTCANSVSGAADTATLRLAAAGDPLTTCATVSGSANIPPNSISGNPVGLGAMLQNDTGSVPIAQLFQIDYLRLRYPFVPTR